MPKLQKKKSNRPSTCDLDSKNIIKSTKKKRGPRRSARKSSLKCDFSDLFMDKTDELVEKNDVSMAVTKEIKRLGGMIYLLNRRGYDFDDDFKVLPRNVQLLSDVEWSHIDEKFFYHDGTSAEFEFSSEFRLQKEDLEKYRKFFKDENVEDYYFLATGDIHIVINAAEQKGARDPEIIALDSEKGNEVARCNLSRFLKDVVLRDRPKN